MCNIIKIIIGDISNCDIIISLRNSEWIGNNNIINLPNDNSVGNDDNVNLHNKNVIGDIND